MIGQVRRGIAALAALPLAIAIALPALGNERAARGAPLASTARTELPKGGFPAPPAGPSTDAVFVRR